MIQPTDSPVDRPSVSGEPGISVRDLASKQRWLLWGFLLLFFCNIASLFVPLLVLAAFAVQLIFIVLVGLTVAAMRRPTASIVLACIGMLLPLISLIVLLAVNARATRILRSAGLHVGLMGVNLNKIPADIR